MNKIKKSVLSLVLAILLTPGLMAGMSLTAYADGTIYNPASTYTGFGALNSSDTEVTISGVTGKKWYVIANDSSTVTLLSKESFGNQVFNSDISKGNSYVGSDIKTFVDGLTGEGQPLAEITSVIFDGPTLIETSVAQRLSETKKKGAGTTWWLGSPGNNDDNNAAFVNGENGNVNENGNNVKKEFGVRPALPDCRKCMEGSVRQCIGQRNPVPFLRRHPREKHMLSETLDAKAFKALGVGDAPFPRQPIGRR